MSVSTFKLWIPCEVFVKFHGNSFNPIGFEIDCGLAANLPYGIEDGEETWLEGVFKHFSFFLILWLFKIIFELK